VRKNSITVQEIIVGLMLLLAVVYFLGQTIVSKKVVFPEIVEQILAPLISPSITLTPSPTPRARTLAEMDKLFGPCVNLPTLMYHHVEPEAVAIKNKRVGLNVPPEMFKKQMEYLISNNYSIITPKDLIDFFDSGKVLPAKPVMITFDDGYVDIGDVAFPIMREMKIKATIYIPTGLMENFSYLTWAKIEEMKSSGLITFGNHTWSHKNVGADREVVKYEISTADGQLSEKGLGDPKTFVYPYGLENNSTEKLLDEMGYQLAFTTVPGRVMCEKRRLSLPRIRIGNASLSVFGL